MLALTIRIFATSLLAGTLLVSQAKAAPLLAVTVALVSPDGTIQASLGEYYGTPISGVSSMIGFAEFSSFASQFSSVGTQIGALSTGYGSMFLNFNGQGVFTSVEGGTFSDPNRSGYRYLSVFGGGKPRPASGTFSTETDPTTGLIARWGAVPTQVQGQAMTAIAEIENPITGNRAVFAAIATSGAVIGAASAPEPQPIWLGLAGLGVYTLVRRR